MGEVPALQIVVAAMTIVAALADVAPTVAVALV